MTIRTAGCRFHRAERAAFGLEIELVFMPELPTAPETRDAAPQARRRV